MARQHLERADIALLVADSAQGITSHDATIASYAEQSGRSVIIVMNKWDLALEAAQGKSSEEKKRGGKFVAFNANKLVQDYEPLVRARLKFLSYAPVVFLSAKTGENMDRLYNLIDKVVEARTQTHFHRRAESLGRQSGSHPRHFARQPRSEDFLHHSGEHFSAHFCAVH